MNIVLACSGPSLRVVNLNEAGCEICAISTTIQFVPNPHFWVFVDKPNRNYGDDFGKRALVNPNVRKICPEYCRPSTYKLNKRVIPRKNCEFVAYNEKRADAGRFFMDGGETYMRMTHKSVLLAVQWAVRSGYTRLIFAGCDLRTDISDPYCWEYTRLLPINTCAIKNSYHQEINDILKQWHPIATEHGIEFLSWTPDSPINEYMHKFHPLEALHAEHR